MKKTCKTKTGQKGALVSKADLSEFWLRMDEEAMRLGRRNPRCKAKANPLGVSWLTALGGAAVVGGAVWVYGRSAQQDKLAEMLSRSKMVADAQAQGLVPWTPDEKARQIVRFFNITSPEHGYALVLAELQALMPTKPEDLINLTDDAKRVFEEKTGIDVDAAVASVYDKLPHVDVSSWSVTKWFTGGN